MCAKLINDYASSGRYLVNRIKTFLSEEVGWALAQTIEESTSVNDYVMSSEYHSTSSSGTVVSGTFCVRFSGGDDYISLYGYDSCYTTPSGVFLDGEIHNAPYSTMQCPNEEFEYWVIADSDCVKLVVGSNDSEEYYHGYVGLIESMYYPEYDETPLLVFCTSSGTSSWVDGVSANMTTSSGNVRPYSLWITYSDDFADSSRISRIGGIRPILYLSSPFSEQEVRGLPKGVLKIPDEYGGNGVMYTVGSGIYYAFSIEGAHQSSYMYGPVYI